MLVRQSSRALHVVTPGLRQFSEHHGKRKAMKILPAGGDPAKVRRGKAGELAIPAAKSFIYICIYIYIYYFVLTPIVHPVCQKGRLHRGDVFEPFWEGLLI